DDHALAAPTAHERVRGHRDHHRARRFVRRLRATAPRPPPLAPAPLPAAGDAPAARRPPRWRCSRPAKCLFNWTGSPYGSSPWAGACSTSAGTVRAMDGSTLERLRSLAIGPPCVGVGYSPWLVITLQEAGGFDIYS